MELQPLKKWVACIDLTSMDQALIGYINYLATIIKPESVQLLHIIESYDVFHDLIEEFPELETEEDLNELLTGQISEEAAKGFSHKDVSLEVVIKKGSPTGEIIRFIEQEQPDLLILGKKAGYKGEGILAQRIVKYVPCSVLFVPETARYTLENITVPVDFSEQSELAARTALTLVKHSGGRVTAQHLYDYPKQFFPYMPDKKTMRKMDEDLAAQREAFLGKIKTPGETDLDFELTLHKDGKMSDSIYELCVSTKSDMIVVFAKARKNMLAMMNDKLPERMAQYPFGIPPLILKHKARNQKLFSMFVKS